MPPFETFLWGSGAFLLGEAVQVYLSIRLKGSTPKCYRSVGYWLLMLPMAAGAGGLAVAMDAQNKMNAVFIGLACPFIIGRFLAEQKRSDGKPAERTYSA